MTIKGIIKRALEYQELTGWARQRSLPGVIRPFLEPARAVLRRKTMTVQKKAAIKAFVGADYWTQDKLWQRGCSCIRSCQACGAEVGDQQHRFCSCPALDEERKEIGSRHEEVVRRAGQGRRGSPLWSRCLVDHPVVDPNKDVQEYQQHQDGEDQISYSGMVYTDGSGKGVGRLKGYGWGFVFLDGQGGQRHRWFGMVPGIRADHSAFRAELWASAKCWTDGKA